MEALLEKGIEGLNLDRSDWQLVKFGDVAIQQKQTVDRENTDLTRYVKGEHMYSEDLHLRKWGELKDEYLGPAFIRKFEEGDILYGSRRTYLRKVAIAPFEGITSNTTFVIKANEERIDKRLLPYVMLSEGFAQHSIRNSKGSVNPYVNWKDLSGYEFLLPPIEKQSFISELFLQLDDAIEKLDLFQKTLAKTKKSFFRAEIRELDSIKLEKVADVHYGLGQPPEKDDNGVSIIRATDIQRGQINEGSFLKVKRSAIPKGKKVELINGDIIIVRSGAYTGDLAMIPDHLVGSFAGYDLIIRHFKKEINPIFLAEYLLDDHAQAYFKGESIRSAQPHLNSKQVLNTNIPELELDRQNIISNKLVEYYGLLKDCSNKIRASILLYKSIINQVF
ncbi:MAG: type I restriction enzyme S subunit [Oleispira sp.]|jgi:type I restriction enzyme S subunit